MPSWIAKAFASVAIALSLLLVLDSVQGLNSRPNVETPISIASTGR